MIDRNKVYILMSRKISGEATVAELEELARMLEEDPELGYAFNILEDVESVHDNGNFSFDEAEALKLRGMGQLSQWLKEQPPQPGVATNRYRWIYAAAACLAVIATVAAFVFWPNKAVRSYANEVVTKNGSKTSLTLPDGSTVILNACSRLLYDADKFLKGDRVVSLTGEAFFDVKHDPEHPFIVRSGQLNIKVLGTTFNVKAYDEDARVEATLISGKIAVDFTDAKTNKKQEVILQPLQKLVINKADIIHEKRAEQTALSANFSIVPSSYSPASGAGDSLPIKTDWMDDRFEFDQITLSELAHDIERWYNVTIIFKNTRYSEETVTGVFKKQNIREILDALQLTVGFQYKLDESNKTITIW
ncbi:hypothetical protein COR50_00775 [Chitinophaga caeni]|uniref:FecR family protein n=2 Tax=Chitinophaga caeni TaxID=2029983 RepID=A0A291QP88_9BACT|nr:hypothetical protein COR50_00775 [Chitinophaga caeni]